MVLNEECGMRNDELKKEELFNMNHLSFFIHHSSFRILQPFFHPFGDNALHFVQAAFKEMVCVFDDADLRLCLWREAGREYAHALGPPEFVPVAVDE
jgi:hypothetical protein